MIAARRESAVTAALAVLVSATAAKSGKNTFKNYLLYKPSFLCYCDNSKRFLCLKR